MRRKAETALSQWKHSKDRQPLILEGARQVGKTYLLHQFGSAHFRHVHSFNFEETPSLTQIFKGSLSPTTLLPQLSLASGVEIDLNSDLLIFDEAGECTECLTALKYFAEQLPELAICAAGSLLGVRLSGSYPVGKVQHLALYPMTFFEFLEAYNKPLLNACKQSINDLTTDPFTHSQALSAFQEYCVTGGLPKAVEMYLKHLPQLPLAFESTRQIQSDLIKAYQSDFVKHAGKVRLSLIHI